MHKPLAFLTFGALLALLPGCFLFAPELPDLDDGCAATSFRGPEPAAQRNVALGEGLGAEFRPYQPGDKAELVVGGQGATMITPVLRVDAAPSDPSKLCTLVTLTTIYVPRDATSADGVGGSSGDTTGTGGGGGGSGDVPASERSQQIVTLSLSNGHLLSLNTFYDPLAFLYSPSLHDLKLTVQVRAADFTATQTITVQGK